MSQSSEVSRRGPEDQVSSLPATPAGPHTDDPTRAARVTDPGNGARVGSRDKLAERVTAACYGTILVLAALAVLKAGSVSSGLGWELVTGVGLATWIAHIYAEVVGDHLRHQSAPGRREIERAMADGSPILLAALAPAAMLFLGRIDVVAPATALWAAVVIAILQLVGVGALVGWVVSRRAAGVWRYAGATAAVGLAVVTLKVLLAH